MGKLEHVRILIKGGANPNKVQWNGLTSLIQAVRYAYTDVIALLLECGADATYIGPDGLDSFALAKKAKRPDVLSLLRKVSAKRAEHRPPRKASRRKS